VRLTEEEVIRIARAAVAEMGWPLREPVHASRPRRRWLLGDQPYWEVMTNADCRGCNAYIRIDDATGEVVSKGFLPR
jgi:hypothetical protein